VEERAIVMELVEGRDLPTPMPLEEALPVARQIAEALEAAHEKGIIHRDLKPANIKLTPEGVVKVLDFGLAKAIEPLAAASTANSPTLTLRSTQLGVIMGTAGYMAPEQAAGKIVDRRADIWAFGVVLYEMLTGTPLFGGETVAHTLADVLRAPIELEKLPTGTPASVRTLIARCLDRNAKTRLRDIGEARIALSMPVEAAPAPPRKQNRLLPIVATAAALLGIVDFGVRYFSRPAATSSTPARFVLSLPPGTVEVPTGNAPMWVPSPDGRFIAFPTAGDQAMLWVREIGSITARPLTKAANANFPFWSPDSQSIGYFSATGIERVSLSDGSVRTICETGSGVYNRSGGGGAWSPEGIVLFQSTGGLQQCPASGGAPSPVTNLDAGLRETSHIWPQFLPDGKHFLYLARSEDSKNSAIYVQELGSKTRVRVMNSVTRAMWAPPGWLLYGQDETLLARRFDLSSFRVTGDPVTVESNLAMNEVNGRAAFAASSTGVLVSRMANLARMSLAIRDRIGNQLRTIAVQGAFSNLRLSPDERLASTNLTSRHPSLWNTWTVDLASGAAARAGFDPTEADEGAAWSPDGKQIAYTRQGGTLWRQTVGAADAAQIPIGFPADAVRDWSPDGRLLVVTSASLKTYLVPVMGDRNPEQVLDLPLRRTQHRISPDGKWIAYAIGNAERTDVWLASFPDFGNRRQVSVAGGSFPVWRKDSRELYYLEPDATLRAVSLLTQQPGAPQRLFQLNGVRRGYIYAALSDGHFLVLEGLRPEDNSNVVTLNWTAGLKP
jgi:serine/threonine protein kinase